jgi:GNAT superfamily N-acetyltransferase
VIVRDATPADAVAACEVMRAPIAELCAADHHNDPDILRRWLGNKTPEHFGSWLADPGASLLLAVEEDAILAVGSVRNDGEITLNYVAPAARFRGASTALLNALEMRAAERGNSHCKLVSTETAHRFYSARGYVDTGPPERRFGTSSSYPMAKAIQVSQAETRNHGTKPLTMELRSSVTCPICGHQATETMPVDACQFFYDCKACGTRLKPKAGDCCVFCSYGTVPCPPIQMGISCCK